MAEVSIAREGTARPLNAVGGARRRENPFRGITERPMSAAYRAELEEQGVNMRMVDAMRRDERNRRIDEEYERQVNQLRIRLREKYPLAGSVNAFGMEGAQARLHRAGYNRELNQGARRLKRLAAAAKRK